MTASSVNTARIIIRDPPRFLRWFGAEAPRPDTPRPLSVNQDVKHRALRAQPQPAAALPYSFGTHHHAPLRPRVYAEP
ncbi:hypothetical protein VTK26DRAFT_8522 [Humicola hyalothermophila]